MQGFCQLEVTFRDYAFAVITGSYIEFYKAGESCACFGESLTEFKGKYPVYFQELLERKLIKEI